MAGPALALNVTSPGQKSVEDTTSAVKQLAAALRDLPKASAELRKLQQALAGAGGGAGGLKGGAGDLKELVGEIKNLGAQLNTSFGSLEETIKKGLGKTRKAYVEESRKTEEDIRESARRMAAAQNLAQAEMLSKAQAAGDRARLKKASGSAEATQQMLYGTDVAAIAALRAHYQGIVAAEQAGAAALAAEYQKSIGKLDALVPKVIKAATQPGYKPAGPAWWDEVLAKQAAATAKLEAEYQKSIGKLDALVPKVIKAATQPGYKPAGPAWWDEVLAKQAAATAKLEAEYQKSIGKLDALVPKVIKAATQPGYKPAGPAWWDEVLAKQAAATAKLEAEYQKSIGKLDALVPKVIKAATQPGYKPAGPAWWDEVLAKQEAALQKMQTLNAKFAAMSPAGQARATLTGAARLAKGVSPEAVGASLGSDVLAAAQGTTLEAARAAAYPVRAVGSAAKEAGEHAHGAAPKFKFFSTSISDAHSAARGLASGFGVMYLTWGRLMPLLAGAAISNSFVQSLKIGSEVRQDLETMRVLSQESASAIAGLEKQLISLGQNGPYGPREVAEAMKVLSLAGLGAEQVAATIKPALDLAIVGQTTIEKSASALVAVGTAYGYQAEQFGLVGDAMSKAAAISMSSVDGMMESFRSASVVGQQYKVSLNDTATALAILANVGIRNSAAGTAVRQMYSELSGASSNTRRAMKQLGVEVIDTTTGGMKPLLTIVKDLNVALSSKSPTGYQRAIQDMSNERGAKSLVALLEAFSAKAKEAGSTVPRELDRIQQAIANAPGFSAISSAQLSATPQNQMKAVSSSFQTALFESFKVIEPTLMVLAARMKEAFASPEFRDAVAGLAAAVANLSVFLVEHVRLLGYVAGAYAAWKGASIGLAVVSTAIDLVTAAHYRNVTAAAATSAAATAAAAASRTAWLSMLGPVGIAVGAVAALWGVYQLATTQASVGEYDAARVRNEVVLASLSAESARLEEVNGKLRERLGLENSLSKKPVQDEAANQVEDEYRKAERNLQGKTLARSRVAPVGAVYESLSAEVARAQEEVDRLQREMYDYGRRIGEGVVSVTQKSQENARLTALQARQFGMEGPDDIREKEAQAKREREAQAARDRTLRALQKQYNQQEALADETAKAENEYLKLRHKEGYDDYKIFADATDRVAEDSASRKLRAHTNFYRQARALLFGKGGEILPGAEQYVEWMEVEGRKVFDALAQQKRMALQRDTEPAKVIGKIDKAVEPGRTGPAWRDMLEDWQDAQKQMLHSGDEFMTSFVERGRTMWQEWMLQGKLSFKSLGDLFKQTFADIVYKRFIAGPMANLGSEMFDRLLKPVATVSAQTTAAGAAEDVRSAFSGLGDVAMRLSDSLGGLGQDFWRLFMEAGRGLASMLSANGATGAGNFLANLFTGDSVEQLSGPGMPSAKGNAFNSGLYAFANGGLPTNSVINSPHFFKFGAGKLGVAGEAGPEAIMPLSRGPGGDLGVRVHGGGGGGQVVAKTSVVIENHGNGAEPKVSRETQPDGSELIRVVLNATAKDISRGGSVRKSMQNVSSRKNLPRY